jgi:hypothetical protein
VSHGARGAVVYAAVVFKKTGHGRRFPMFTSSTEASAKDSNFFSR